MHLKVKKKPQKQVEWLQEKKILWFKKKKKCSLITEGKK